MHFPKVRKPKIDEKLINTVAAACLITIIYAAIGRNVCFAAIGVVYAMGTNGTRHGIERFYGTVVGGTVALLFYWMYSTTPFGIPSWVFLTVGLFFVLLFSHTFGVEDSINPGTVVFYVVLCTVPSYKYVSYTVARMLDTLIGVFFAMGVNYILHKFEVNFYKKKPAAKPLAETGDTEAEAVQQEDEVLH